MDMTSVTAVVGAITGCASLLWNINTYVGFDLEIYSHHLSFEREADPWKWKEIQKLTEANKDISKYSDDVIVLRGWFKFLLRKEGKRFNNHHVDSMSLELDNGLRNTLVNILAEPPLFIVLFPYGETKDLRLCEGAPSEVEVHSNPLFLKREWKSFTNLRPDELTKKLNECLEKGKYKINVQLTTYRYPLTYKKEGDWCHREHLWERAVNSIRWRLKI